MGKKALLVVSFGTSYEDAMPAIVNLEEICQKAFPDYDFFRAFTSGFIISSLKRKKNMVVMNPEEAMEKLAGEGYEEVLCQPTHIIKGFEYDKLVRMIEPFKEQIPSIRLGAPLLSEEEDYIKACHIVMDQLPGPLADKEAFLLMGHGTEHSAHISYGKLQKVFHELGYTSTYLATVESQPGIEELVEIIRQDQIETATIMPFMIVAGDHARNDLAGDEEDSWKSILHANGFATKEILKGLGQIDAIGQIYVEHLKEATKL